jgi:hypothetical protein
MTRETHSHCQCDFCSGEDCGNDNPDKKNAEEKARQEEHDSDIRKEVLSSFDGFIDAYRREDEDGHDYVSVLALQNHIEYLMEKKA